MKTALFIIDPQNDFASKGGNLFIPGADKDMARLGNFIIVNQNEIDNIFVSLDTHDVNDIGHPGFWKNQKGELPQPFSRITYKDFKDEKWVPRNKIYFKYAKKYLNQLDKNNESHIIWPIHCIDGHWGNAIVDNVGTALIIWSNKKETTFKTIRKGKFKFSEFHGVFKPHVQIKEFSDSNFNENLFEDLNSYDRILIAGEAKSHCVAETINQMMEKDSSIMKKVIILEDCMTNIESFEHIGEPVYIKALKNGAQFRNSQSFKL